MPTRNPSRLVALFLLGLGGAPMGLLDAQHPPSHQPAARDTMTRRRPGARQGMMEQMLGPTAAVSSELEPAGTA